MKTKLLLSVAFLFFLLFAKGQNKLIVTIVTGGDDLRTNSIAEGIIHLQGGSQLRMPLNNGQGWGNNSRNVREYLIPSGISVSQFTGFTLTFRSGDGGAFSTGDNWNVDQIRIDYQTQSIVNGRAISSIATLAERSGTPWVRHEEIPMRGRGYIPITYQAPTTNANVNISGVNLVQSVSSAKFMGIAGGQTQDGALAIQWDNTNQVDIRWDFIPEGGNIYRIRNLNSGRFLAIGGGARTSGERALQWIDSGQADLYWELINLGNGTYKIRNRNSGLVLGVAGNSLQNAANIVQLPDGAQNNLRWRITPIVPIQTLELRGFQVFAHCNYGGPVGMTEGYHRTLPAGVPNDGISGLQSGNLRITLYEHANFKGNCVVLPFGAQVPCLTAQNFNDAASSLITTRW